MSPGPGPSLVHHRPGLSSFAKAAAIRDTSAKVGLVLFFFLLVKVFVFALSFSLVEREGGEIYSLSLIVRDVHFGGEVLAHLKPHSLCSPFRRYLYYQHRLL